MSPPLSMHDRHCHADPGCRRTPRFRAQLHRTYQTPDQSPVAKTVDTCADHLGDTAQALARWASSTGFGSGLMQFSVVGSMANHDDPYLAAFPFAVIHLLA